MRRIILLLCIAVLLFAGWFFLARKQTDVPDAPVTRSAQLGLVLLDQEGGVYVLAIRDRSPAGRAGIHAGDLLLRADDTPLQSVQQLDALLTLSTGRLPLTLERDTDILTVQLRLPHRDMNAP